MTVEKLSEIKPIVARVVEWCIAQPDVTGFAVRLEPLENDTATWKDLSRLVVTLNFGPCQINHCLTLASMQAGYVLTAALEAMAKEARQAVAGLDQKPVGGKPDAQA